MKSCRRSQVAGRTSQDQRSATNDALSVDGGRWTRFSSPVTRHLLRFLLVACLLWSGCGYSTKSLLPSHLRTIYVQPFANRIPIGDEVSAHHPYQSSHPLLENDVTNAVIDRYIFDGNVKVSPVETEADMVLIGELIAYYRDPVRFSEGRESVEEYRLSLVTHLTLTDRRKGVLMWEETNFVGDTTYFLSGSLAKSDATAIEAAVQDLARRIVERTIEAW